MLKETETEETIDFFVTFLLLAAFQLVGAPTPLATLMGATLGKKLLIFIITLNFGYAKEILVVF